VVFHHEKRIESGQGQSALRPQTGRDSGDHVVILPIVDVHAEGTLTQADRRIEGTVQMRGRGQVSGVPTFEQRTLGRVGSGHLDEVLADVDSMTVDPATREFA